MEHRTCAWMKKTRYIRGVLVSILILGGLFWLIRSTRAPGPSVDLVLVKNSPVTIPGGTLFRITNGDERAILLTDVIVETNSPSGWHAFSHTIPAHPQRLATGDTKEFVIVSLKNEKTWRLRITYGEDVKGPRLLLAKVDHAIFQHSWPVKEFGIMAGSNSCVYEVTAR